MESIFNTESLFAKCMAFRNSQIRVIEASFFFLNCVLFILSWVLLILGFELTGTDVIGSAGSDEIDKAHDFMVIFNWIIAILLIVCSICGLKIAIDRRMSSVLNVCYFILLFFFLTIPLLSEGKVLLTIGEFVENKNIDKIETTCKQHRDVIEKEVSSPIARNFFLLAHRFDTISEEILDS